MRSGRSWWLGLVVWSTFMVACGTEQTETVQRPPEIRAFAADPTLIPAGGTSTLRWITNHAVSVEVLAEGVAIDLRGSGVAEGSVAVQPALSTEYTLVARGGDGKEARESLLVTVEEGAAIAAKIWVEPERVTIGETATVHWQTSHANHVAITRNGNSMLSSSGELSGSRVIETHETTEFKLVAKGPLGEAEATAVLQVQAAIHEFRTSATQPVFPGDEVEIHWKTTGAEQLVLSSSDGFELDIRKESFLQGSTRAPVPQDGMFRLVATRGEVKTVRELEVELVGPPEVIRFQAAPLAITEGMPPKDQIRLSWQIQNVNAIRIESSHHGVIDVTDRRPSADGVQVEQVPAGTVFRLVASNAMAEAEATFTFEAVPPARVESLRVVPSRVGVGEPVFVAWTAEDAVSVTLHHLTPPTKTRLPIDPEALEGTHELVLEAASSFVLAATNLAGDSTEREIEVPIALPLVSASVEELQVRPGEDIVFRWDNDGGSQLEIVDLGGVQLFFTDDVWLIDEGSIALPAPTEEGNYLYEVVVGNGMGSRRRPLEVLVSNAPKIHSFTVDPGPIPLGDSVTFRWEVASDSQGNPPNLVLVDDLDKSYDLSGFDPNDGEASFPMVDPGVRTFTLIASSPASAYPALAEATTDVFGPPELIFEADPGLYDPFNRTPISLQWQTRFATGIAIHRIDADGNFLDVFFEDQRRTVAESGRRNFVPEPPGEWLRIIASNPWGESVAEEFYAEFMMPTIQSFQVSPTSVAPNGTVTVSWDTGGGPAFLNGPLLLNPMEQLEDKPFEPIAGRQGTQALTMQSCGTDGSATDEACIDVTLPPGFSFPFEGKDLTVVRPYTNGWINLDLSVPKSGNIWTQISGITLPTATHRYIQLAGYGQDLYTMTLLHWREDTDNEGRHVVFEWNPGNGGAGQFQIALYESGAFEYRYGPLNSGSSPRAPVFVGYQNRAGTRAFTLPGGNQLSTLANRVWRYEPRVSATGSQTFTLTEDTTFRLCVHGGTGVPVCEEQTVTVGN